MTLEDIKETLSPLASVKMNDAQREKVREMLQQRMASEIPNTSRRRTARFRYGVPVVAGVVVAVGFLAAANISFHNITTQSPAKPTHPTQTTPNPPRNTKPHPTTPLHLNSLYMANKQVGWAAEVGRILRTTDGGSTWKDVTPPDMKALYAQTNYQFANVPALISAVDEQTAAIAVTTIKTNADSSMVYVPTIYATQNGGQTWTKSLAPRVERFGSGEIPVFLRWENMNHGWLVSQVFSNGGEARPVRTLYETMDGGNSWRAVAHSSKVTNQSIGSIGLLPGMNELPGVQWVKFFAGGVGLTQGQDSAGGGIMNPASTSLYRTTDGGLTWDRVPIHLPFKGTPDSVIFLEPGMIGPQIGVPLVVTYRSPKVDAQLFLLGSKDGGKTFTTNAVTNVGSVSGVMQDQFFGQLCAINLGGKFYFTDGQSVRYAANLGDSHATVQLLDEREGYAVVHGRLWKSDDGGRHWSAMDASVAP